MGRLDPLFEHLARVIELANGHANVGIGRHANANAQLGAALGDLAAYGPMLSVGTVLKTMVVDLDNLVLGLSRQQHLVDIERHGLHPIFCIECLLHPQSALFYKKCVQILPNLLY